MTRTLSKSQAVVLGMVVLGALSLAAWGMIRIGHKTNLFGDTFEMIVFVPDAHDIEKGTPVRIRGVEAGKVVAVEYPEDDGMGEGVGEDGTIRVRLQLDKKFAGRIYADASASIVSKGLLGSSFLAIQPGKPVSGPLASKAIRSQPQADLAEVTAKLSAVATRVDNVLREVELGNGTAGKLLRDDSLYNEIKQLSADSRKLVKNADETITSLRGDAQSTLSSAKKTIDGVNSSVVSVQGEVAGLKDLVRICKEAITAIKQNAEAIKSMPIVRNYITDEVKVMVRPNYSKDRVVYAVDALFEPNQAVLTESGRQKISETAAWLRGQKPKGSEVVVVSFADPKSKEETYASARELTKKQSEIVATFLRDNGAAKLGTFTSRDITPVGLGFDSSPVVEKEDLPTARTEIILFIPR